MAAAKKAGWKQWIAQARQYAKQGRDKLYERVVILAKVYDDKVFRADMLKEGKNWLAVLDEEIQSDTFANSFSEVYAILKSFPRKEQWANGNLTEMRRAVLYAKGKEAQNQKNAAKEEHAPRNGKATAAAQTMSWKLEALKLRERVKLLEQENLLLKGEVATLKEILKTLKPGSSAAS